MKHVWSFDVYDTVITRNVFRPDELFLLIGQQLIEQGVWYNSVEQWRDLRITAERNARKDFVKGLCEEITLDQIYNKIRTTTNGALARVAQKLELQFELENVIGITEIIQRIHKLVNQGEHVCYVSDMYLPKSFVAKCLIKVGAPECNLFVSSEVGKTKATGSLFKVVAEHYGISFSQLIHCGDNHESDGVIPRRLGVTVERFKGSQATWLEQEMHCLLSQRDPTVATQLVGRMRAVRLSPPTNLDDISRALWTHGTQEGGLLHIGFTMWLTSRILQGNFELVCFLARDGYLPYKLYEYLRCRHHHLPPAQYLYVSRQSLHSAALRNQVTEEDKSWILAKAEGLTFGEWLFRLGLDRQMFQEDIGDTFEVPADDFIIHPNHYSLCEALLDNPLFIKKLTTGIYARRKIALSYFQQQGVMSTKRLCFVDIGWHGRMQRSLESLLSKDINKESGREITGLYLGLLRVPEDLTGNSLAWLFDCRSGSGNQVSTYLQLYETLFSAPHGTTLGYQRNNGDIIVPLLAEWDAAKESWGDINLMHEAIISIFDTLPGYLESFSEICDELTPLIKKATHSWFYRPCYSQALAFSRFGFGSDQSSREKEKLIYNISLWRSILITLRISPAISMHHWVHGQLSLAGGIGWFTSTLTNMLNDIISQVRSLKANSFLRRILPIFSGHSVK